MYLLANLVNGFVLFAASFALEMCSVAKEAIMKNWTVTKQTG